MELIQKQRFDEAEKDIKRKRREVGQARKRIAELDRIFKRIYEDDINGTISHERFLKLSAEYEAEQKELTEKVKAEQQEVDTYEQNKSDFDSFTAIIRKYVRITKLTPTIVNEFVKKMIVHAPDKSEADTATTEQIPIVWSFIGVILEQDENKQTIERQDAIKTTSSTSGSLGHTLRGQYLLTPRRGTRKYHRIAGSASGKRSHACLFKVYSAF